MKTGQGKAVGYLRVSTGNQVGEDKFGLAAQKQAITTYARENGFELVEWQQDRGISGATLDRPGLSDIFAGAKEGRFAVVLVAKMDRIARDLMLQLWIEKELLKYKVEIVSAAEPFRGQDPTNKLFRQIIGAFAEFEKSRIADRLTGGRKEKARQGGYAGGVPALGYKATRGKKSLAVDEEKAAAVKRIFELARKRSKLTLQQIADKLNEEGHTAAQGKPFHKMQVKRVLDRKSLYQGKYSYAGIEAPGKHKSIL